MPNGQANAQRLGVVPCLPCAMGTSSEESCRRLKEGADRASTASPSVTSTLPSAIRHAMESRISTSRKAVEGLLDGLSLVLLLTYRYLPFSAAVAVTKVLHRSQDTSPVMHDFCLGVWEPRFALFSPIRKSVKANGAPTASLKLRAHGALRALLATSTWTRSGCKSGKHITSCRIMTQAPFKTYYNCQSNPRDDAPGRCSVRLASPSLPEYSSDVTIAPLGQGYAGYLSRYNERAG